MKKILIFTFILVIGLMPFSACSQTDNVIKINEVTHSLFYAPFYLADSLGIFEKNGIKIELINGGGSDASMTAILSKSADVALCGPETTIYVYQQGRQDYPVVFGQLTKRDGAFLVGR
ncbi:MAG: ABC transporter substrate-binding protein, partial [Clostridia bacterium]|nr:ABC transporter substrate-binding protein [Clostridia bacterium]